VTALPPSGDLVDELRARRNAQAAVLRAPIPLSTLPDRRTLTVFAVATGEPGEQYPTKDE
jgi:hypothetical protein